MIFLGSHRLVGGAQQYMLSLGVADFACCDWQHTAWDTSCCADMHIGLEERCCDQRRAMPHQHKLLHVKFVT